MLDIEVRPSLDELSDFALLGCNDPSVAGQSGGPL